MLKGEEYSKTQKRLPEFVKEEEMNQLLDHAVIFENTFEGLRDKLIHGAPLWQRYAPGRAPAAHRFASINLNARTIRVLGKRNKERVIPFGENLVPNH